jgi:predicted glycosyltransferase
LPENLRIDPYGDAHDLILSASVVIGLNSTTLIEAAMAGLPVILPYFRYVREGPHGVDVLLRDKSDLFDVPDTAEDLIELVLRRLRDPSIPEEIMQRRRRLFAEAISPLDGEATERYLKLLQQVVAEKGSATRPTPAVAAMSERGIVGL